MNIDQLQLTINYLPAMKLKELFLKQLAYNDAMNLTMIHRLKDLEHPPHETVELLGHIVKAELLWLERLYGTEKIKKSFFENWPLSEIESHQVESHKGWISALNEYDEEGLNTIFAYHNLKGEAFENSLYDILFHVINHSTHHRAQISKILRQHDIAPPVMDYINYVREH